MSTVTNATIIYYPDSKIVVCGACSGNHVNKDKIKNPRHSRFAPDHGQRCSDCGFVWHESVITEDGFVDEPRGWGSPAALEVFKEAVYGLK